MSGFCRAGLFLTGLVLAALSGCEQPINGAQSGADGEALKPASPPMASPDTTGAIWAASANLAEGLEARIIYGQPGQSALLALACAKPSEGGAKIAITRLAPADNGASALLAMVGNGHITRIPVEAQMLAGRSVWHGELAAADDRWEPLAGPRGLTLTVPGAGMVTINPSDAPARLIADCRGTLPARSAF